MPRKYRSNLCSYTERAIIATEAGKLIPTIVYLPKMLREQKPALTANNLALTMKPPTVEDNRVRIAEADPLGFLMAVMNGQPIPEFRVTDHGAVEMHYVMPKIGTRMIAANYLGGRILPKPMGKRGPPKPPSDHDAMIAAVGGGDVQEA